MIPFNHSGAFDPVAEGSELRRLAVRGAAATVTAAALGLGVQVVSTLVLARLLTPADFGVVTMVTTVSLVLMSFGLNGFEQLVIQRRELDRFQASNLFWINCGVGFILAIGFAALGSLLARFYGEPQITQITVGIAPAIFIASTSVIHVALLKRAMRFAAVSAIEVANRVVNTAIAILLAFEGWGYWALVVGIVASTLTTSLGAWSLCRWMPSLPRRGLGTRAMLTFAASVYGRFAANYFARNFDNVLVGWRFHAAGLGFYKKAYDLFLLPAAQLSVPVTSVVLATLSRLNHEPERFKRSLTNTLGAMAFVGMAVSADLTLIGQEVVRLVLGPEWAESGRIFELFGPGIGIMLLYGAVGWIHLSLGKPERWLRWTIVETAITVLSFILALPWGPQGVAAAWTLSYWALAIPAFWYAGRPIEFHISDLIAIVWRYVAAAISAGLACAALARGVLGLTVASSAAEALQQSVVKSVLFVILYLFAVVLLHQGFEPLLRVAGLLREMLPGPGPARWWPASAATSGADASSSPKL
jgi:O-antigen/teichoic acid export membrane protein